MVNLNVLGKYKAKRFDNGEWVEGNLIFDETYSPFAFIVTKDALGKTIIPLDSTETDISIEVIRVMVKSIEPL